MHWLGLAFACLLLAQAAVRVWLAARQIAAVSAHCERVPDACRKHVSLEAHRRAAAYTSARVRLGAVAGLVELAVVGALTLGGGIAAIDMLAMRVGLAQPWHGTLVVTCVLLLVLLSRQPAILWRTFRLEASFGFNRATPALFAADFAKQLVLVSAVLVPSSLVIIEAMRRTSWWWLVGWLVWIGVSLGTAWAWPRFIAPLFNRFTPLTGPLAERLEALLRRCRFSAQGLFAMDGSRRSTHGNAYFSGFGDAKRIVLFDTLIARLEPDEIEAVLAHELGHFRLRHVQWRLAVTFVTSFAVFATLGWLVTWVPLYMALGIAAPSEHAALLLFALGLPVVAFWLRPGVAAWSRKHEYEADQFAATHANGRALALALIKLHRDNAATLTPDRFYWRFYDSHPPLTERLRVLESGSF